MNILLTREDFRLYLHSRFFGPTDHRCVCRGFVWKNTDNGILRLFFIFRSAVGKKNEEERLKKLFLKFFYIKFPMLKKHLKATASLNGERRSYSNLFLSCKNEFCTISYKNILREDHPPGHTSICNYYPIVEIHNIA